MLELVCWRDGRAKPNIDDQNTVRRLVVGRSPGQAASGAREWQRQRRAEVVGWVESRATHARARARKTERKNRCRCRRRRWWSIGHAMCDALSSNLRLMFCIAQPPRRVIVPRAGERCCFSPFLVPFPLPRPARPWVCPLPRSMFPQAHHTRRHPIIDLVAAEARASNPTTTDVGSAGHERTYYLVITAARWCGE